MPYEMIDPSTAVVLPGGSLGAPLQGQGMTLRELREQLAFQLGDRKDIPDPTLNLWVNWGYLALCSMVDIEQLKGSISFSSVSTQAQYLLPIAVRNIKAAAIYGSGFGMLGLTRSRPLLKKDIHWFRSQKDLSGQPRYFFREGQVLILYPYPDAAYPIGLDIKIKPKTLTADVDCPLIPEEWHEVILLAARVRAFRALMEFDKASIAQNELVSEIRSKMNTEDIERIHTMASVEIPRDWKDLKGLNLEDDRVQ